MNSIELAEAIEVRSFRSHMIGDPRGRVEVRFRPLVPGDQVALGDFFEAHAAETTFLRSALTRDLPAWELARYFLKMDGFNEFALTGVIQEGAAEQVVAIGRYLLDQDTELAEMSFLVHAGYRRAGIASHLARRISELILARGLAGMTAVVPEANLDMLHVLGEVLAPPGENVTESGQTTLRWFFAARVAPGGG